MNNLSVRMSGLLVAGLFMLTSALMGQGMHGMEPGYMMQGGRPMHGMQDGRGAMFKLWKLTEYLDLTEEQGAKFFPRFNEHRKRVAQILEEQDKLSAAFMEQVEAGKVGKGATEAYMKQMGQLKRAHLEDYEKLLRDAGDLLDDEQYARFAAFEDHFKRQIKARMGNRGMRQDGMRGRKSGKRSKVKKDKD